MVWWQRRYVGIAILTVVCVAVLLLPGPTQAATSYKTLFVGHLIHGERYENSYVYQDEITHHAFTFDAAAGDVLTLAAQWITDPPPAGYGDPWQPVLIITPGVPTVGPGEVFVWDWDADFHDGKFLPKDGNNIEKPTLVDWEVPTTGTYTLYAKFYPYQQSSGGTYSIGFTQSASAPPPEGWTGESPQLEDGDQSLTIPIVYAVLFHSPTCKYSQAVINEFLPPLKEQYGDQFQVLYSDISTTEGLALFQATGATLAPNHVAFSSMSTPTLITGDTILVGGQEIAEQLPGLIRDGLAAGGVDLPPVPGLREAYETTQDHRISDNAGDSGAEIEVYARCEELETPPPAITSDDRVTVFWMWTAREASYLAPHREAVNYIVTLDGVLLSYGDPVSETADAGNHMVYALTWYVDVGRLSVGTHRVDYFATWSQAVSTGLTAYGPGTEHPTEVGGCTFEVADGAGTASSAAQQVDLSNLEAVNYALTAQQSSLLLDIGYPDAFDIIEIDGTNGTVHRLETWRYFRQNTAFVFLDGKFRYDAWEEYPPGGVIPVTVSPDQFPLGSSKQAVIDRFDSRQWQTFTNSVFQEMSFEFLVSEQIILGFKDDRLVYVETIAFPAEEGAQ